MESSAGARISNQENVRKDTHATTQATQKQKISQQTIQNHGHGQSASAQGRQTPFDEIEVGQPPSLPRQRCCRPRDRRVSHYAKSALRPSRVGLTIPMMIKIKIATTSTTKNSL